MKKKGFWVEEKTRKKKSSPPGFCQVTQVTG
jgi:hypothetical protein